MRQYQVDRCMVDTQVVPNHYNTCLASIRPQDCDQIMVSIVCLENALTFSLWTDSTRQEIEIPCWAPHSMYLTCVYLMSPHVTRSPRTSPSTFEYCKQPITGGGNGLGMKLSYLGSAH